MSDPNFFIETPNLYLSYQLPTSEEHCNFLIELFNTPEFIATQGQTGIDTVAKAKARLESYIPTHERLGHGIYLLTLKDPSKPFPAGQLIGQMSFMRGTEEKDKTWFTVPDVGWVVHPRFTGKGYATEAGKGLLKYAKENLGIVEVFAFADEANTASRKVAEKVGLEYRGVLPIPVFKNDLQAVYALPGMKDLEFYTRSTPEG